MTILGLGTTRLAYRLDNGLVMKKHIHHLGYEQSLVERDIYQATPKHLRKYLNEIVEVTPEYQICTYSEPVTTEVCRHSIAEREDLENLGIELFPTEDGFVELLPKELLELLTSKQVVLDDIFASTNLSISQGHIKLLDYGFTESMFSRFSEGLFAGEIVEYVTDICPNCEQETTHGYLGHKLVFCESCTEIVENAFC